MTTEHYDDKTAAAFGREFIEHLKPYPFGGMPKRDLDCLIFSLLKAHDLIHGKMNRDKAYSLGISESKYKSLLVDSDAKFGGERKPEESVKKIFEKLGGNKPGVSLEGDTLVFVEEDYIVKDDFTYAMKEAGFYTDTSFNGEIIKVKAASFLAFASDKGYIGEDKILELLLKDKTDERQIETFKKSKKTWKDMAQDVFGILREHGAFDIHAFLDVGEYVAGVVKANLEEEKAK